MSKRRNTNSKLAVLNILQEHSQAMSQELIAQKLTTPMDRATIYRILNSFCEDGIVHKILGDDGKQYFALCKTCEDGHHHHDHYHFRCEDCGTVECMDIPVTPNLPDGYKVQSVNMMLSGTCQKCN